MTEYIPLAVLYAFLAAHKVSVVPDTPPDPPEPPTPPSEPSVIFFDDFTGSSVLLGSWDACRATDNIHTSFCTGLPADVNDKWFAYPEGWPDTSRNGVYSPRRTLSITGGQMHIKLHNAEGVNWVCAPVPKIPGDGPSGGRLYGTYEIKWRVNSPTWGFKLAWLLWPDSEIWPEDGEIDFLEGELGGNVGAFMHRQDGVNGGDQDGYSFNAPIADGQWHVTKLVWRADRCEFWFDGIKFGHSTSRIPNTPMHLVLQSETALDGTKPTFGSSATIDIDYIKVWE